MKDTSSNIQARREFDLEVLRFHIRNGLNEDGNMDTGILQPVAYMAKLVIED